MGDEIEKLAFELASRTLAQQEAVLNELRARTGTLLAASSLATSFLGVRALDGSGVGAVGGGALTMFIVSLLSSAYVLFPRRGLVFAIGADALLEQSAELSEEHRRLASWLQAAWRSNETVVERLVRAFSLATVSLVAEAMLLTTGLAPV